MMNILYLCPNGNFLGGGEQGFLQLLDYLDKEKFHFAILIRQEGVFYEELKKRGAQLILFKQKMPQAVFWSLKKIIALNKINLIYSADLGRFNLFIEFAAKALKIPFIWHLRVIERNFILDFLQSYLADEIICTSYAVKEKKAYFKSKAKVIYNGIDLNRFNLEKYQAKQNLALEGKILIGTAGVLRPYKNIALFIDLAKRMMPFFGVKFILLGDFINSRYRSKIEGLIRKYRLEDYFLLLGFQPAQEVIPALDIYVSFSQGESFGRSIVEAMWSEAVVVSFPYGAEGELISDKKEGFLVKDVSQAQKIIEKILNGEIDKRKITQAAKEKARQFSLSNYLGKMEEVFNYYAHRN